MERVDFPLLKTIVKQPHSTEKLAKDSSVCLNQFMNMVSNLILTGKNLSESEISLLTISFQQFLNHKFNRARYAYFGDIELGDIFNIDCGLRYDPEISYNHPALVMSKIEELFLVVPSSTSQDKIRQAYHPLVHPDGTWYYYKVNDTDGFKETCALILGNAMIVSKHAFLSKEGHVTQDINDPDSTFQKVQKMIKENMFST